MAKQLLDYFHEQSSKYKKNLKLLGKQPEEDPVHDYRVAVKRLRTVILLLKELYPDNENFNTFITNTNNVYKLSGKLRDMQLQVEMLDNLSKKTGVFYTHYMAYLRKKETSASAALNNYLKEYPLVGKDDLLVLTGLPFWKEIDNVTVMKVVDSLINDLIKHSVSLDYMKRDPDDWHIIRRNLKQCQYLLSMSSTFDHIEHDIHSKKLTIVSHAGELLGNWHDIEVSTMFLSKFHPQIKNVNYFNEKYKDLKSLIKSDMEKNLDSTCLYLKFVFQVFK